MGDKELLIARNPDPGSTLPYLLRVPLGDGIVLRTAGTWPRTKALYCYPVPASEWPAEADIVERTLLRSCVRRGAAVDLVLDRSRENRSQLIFTTARGRDAVFWQSPRTRKQARPDVTAPTARAAGIAQLEIIVDTHERYAYRFATQAVRTISRALPAGDYGIALDDRLAATVERKSLADLISSLTNGTLRYALTELAAVPRACWSSKTATRKSSNQTEFAPLIADGLAECQIRWPEVAIVFCETRPLAEEWTYRYLAAAHHWATTEPAATERVSAAPHHLDPPAAPDLSPSPSEIRAWARAQHIAVPERGRLPADIRQAWQAAHPTTP